MSLKLRSVGIALFAVIVSAGSSQADPLGYGEGRGSGDGFVEFFGGFLYGPRIDPLWNPKTDTPDLANLDQRIQVMETFLGPAGADLIDLRESLALGMTRREYELAAFFSVREIRSSVYEFESPPRFYYGYIGENQVKIALRWLDSKGVIGLYYFAPHNRQGADRFALLEGRNGRQGQLYLEAFNGRTLAARIFLRKRLSADTINWEGGRRGSDGRREQVLMWRRRGGYED